MIIAIAIIVVVLAGAIFLFNRLTRYRYLVREAWSGIDVQLKRRHDLIPNIVEAVKGYERYERSLLPDIAKVRAQLGSARSVREKGEVENDLSRSLKGVFALVEAYPDLKANQSFLDLQRNLTEIEDQIQLARRYYNGTVREYNILVESFPGNLAASLFHFTRADFFEIEYATERQTPDVKFGARADV
jgi:LemA protein